MSEVLVLVDHVDGEVKKVSYELLTAARRLGTPAAVVVGAPGTASKIRESLGRYGAAKVYAVESDDAVNYLTTPKVDALAALAPNASAVLVSATVDGKEVAGRLAVRIDSGWLVDVVDVEADGTGVQSIFGGAFVVKAKVSKGTPVITVRPGGVEAEESAADAVLDESVSISVDTAKAARVTSREAIVGASSGRAYFDGDPVLATKKGVQVLERGSQVHFMGEFQALLAFPPAPKLNVYGKLDPKKATEQELRGEKLFFGKAQCGVCHPAPYYTDNTMHDLKVERFFAPKLINGRMTATDGPIKTFPLRGIKDSPPYLHDGRLLTLEDVVEFFNLVLELKLADAEKKDLVAFLRCL